MSSSLVAGRARPASGWIPSPASHSFASVLRSTPAEDVTLDPSAPASSPSRSRTGQAPEPDPAPPESPTRSRTGQGEQAGPAPSPQSRTPRFLAVPESVKHPNGPYHQAPPEHGGEWWLVSPFTGPEPWLTQGFGDPYAEAPAEEASAELLAVFGPRPNAETHPDRLLRSAALADWERNRDHFQGVGLPEGFTQEQLDAAGDLFESWGMGRPLLYEGRYGWKATFPAADMQGFEASPFTTLEAPHLIVARYQIEMAEHGSDPAQRHPFVPPQVFPDEPLSV